MLLRLLHKRFEEISDPISFHSCTLCSCSLRNLLIASSSSGGSGLRITTRLRSFPFVVENGRKAVRLPSRLFSELIYSNVNALFTEIKCTLINNSDESNTKRQSYLGVGRGGCPSCTVLYRKMTFLSPGPFAIYMIVRLILSKSSLAM